MAKPEGEKKMRGTTPVTIDNFPFTKEQSEEQIDASLRRVGSDKPLGYESLLTVQKAGIDLEALKRELEAKGLKTKLYTEDETTVFGGALYVYDPKSLGELLKTKESILTASGWPSQPEDFIDIVNSVHAPPNSDLFDTIADAYGDYSNIGRKSFPGSKGAPYGH